MTERNDRRARSPRTRDGFARSGTSASDCGFNWSTQHMLGLGDATGSACHIGTNRKWRCFPGLSHSRLYDLGSSLSHDAGRP